MNKSEIIEMLELLFSEFGIEPVPVTVKNVKRTYGGGRIQIGLKVVSTLKRLEDIVLHEFTHSLDWRLTAGRKKYSRSTFQR